jgi:hypothetical protein
MLQAGLLGAHAEPNQASESDVKIARLMVMGAVNFTVTWYKQKTQSEQMDLDALADSTVRFFMHS